MNAIMNVEKSLVRFDCNSLVSKNVPIGQAKYVFWSFGFYIYDSFTANKNPYMLNNISLLCIVKLSVYYCIWQDLFCLHLKTLHLCSTFV